MKGSTHMLVATTTSISAAIIFSGAGSLLGLPVIPWLVPLTAASGGFKADMDMEGNPEARSAKFALYLARRFPFLKKALAHRGFTHTLVIPGLVWILALSLSSSGEGWAIKGVVSCLVGWLIGFLSHLFVDMLNGKGIPIIWPLYFKRVNLMSITTETFEEILFLIFWLILIISHTVLNALGMNL